MNRYALLLVLLALTGCSFRPHMSRDEFYDVSAGTAISTVMEQYGRPDEMKHLGEEKEYVYIDRFQRAPGIMEHIHYVFIVKNGFVTKKAVRRDEAFPNYSVD
jgi:hypothetical protein